jgi:hypothetical protein
MPRCTEADRALFVAEGADPARITLVEDFVNRASWAYLDWCVQPGKLADCTEANPDAPLPVWMVEEIRTLTRARA